MELRDFAPVAVAFVAIAVTVGLGAQILGQMKSDSCADQDGGWYNATSGACQVSSTNATAKTTGYAFNATVDGQESLEEMSSWLPTIALVLSAALIIGIVVYYLASRMN